MVPGRSQPSGITATNWKQWTRLSIYAMSLRWHEVFASPVWSDGCRAFAFDWTYEGQRKLEQLHGSSSSKKGDELIVVANMETLAISKITVQHAIDWYYYGLQKRVAPSNIRSLHLMLDHWKSTLHWKKNRLQEKRLVWKKIFSWETITQTAQIAYR